MTLLGVLVIIAIFWFYQRSFLVGAGQQALSQLPDTIEFLRVPGDAWDDPVTAAWLAKPLREKGFIDLGVYHVLPANGFKLGVMVNENENVAAFLCERPKALGISLELNVRYIDGTTTMLINRADNGVPRPPFFRVIFDPSGASSGALFERLLRERSKAGIKGITEATVFSEYQAAWTRMMRWEKGRGLTAEEVTTIAAAARSGSANPPGAEALPGGSSDAWSPEFPGDAKKWRDAFEVKRDGNALQITWKWGSPAAAILFFVVAIGWYSLNRFMFKLGGPIHDSSLWVKLIPTLWALAPAAGYAYWGLAILLNSRVIRADPMRLTVRDGPIPCLGARDLLTADIARIYSEVYVSYAGHGGGGTFYRVVVIRKSGKELKLLPGVADPAKAEFISQQLNGFLSDQRGGGGFSVL